MRPRIVAIAAALSVVLAGCSAAPQTDSTQGGFVSGNHAIKIVAPADREPAPKIEGTTLDGKHFSLADFTGKTIVINIWGSWCPPCREEAPALDATYTKLKDNGVRFLGISVREQPAAARAFYRSKDISYPSLTDPSGKSVLGFSASLPSVAIPTTWIIDSEGRVAVRIMDTTTESTLTSLIEDVQASTA